MADRRDRDTLRFLMGVGLDPDPEGHTRITKGDEFILLGGSEITHESMQDHVERFQHSLRKLGTSLQHATDAEVRDALARARR